MSGLYSLRFLVTQAVSDMGYISWRSSQFILDISWSLQQARCLHFPVISCRQTIIIDQGCVDRFDVYVSTLVGCKVPSFTKDANLYVGTSLTLLCSVSCEGIVFHNVSLPPVCVKQPTDLPKAWVFWKLSCDIFGY